MSDTSLEVEAMVRERYQRMTPEERVNIASSMFETARQIVEASLSKDMTRRERRLALVRRLYSGELPEAALSAVAEWNETSMDDQGSQSQL